MGIVEFWALDQAALTAQKAGGTPPAAVDARQPPAESLPAAAQKAVGKSMAGVDAEATTC